MKGSSSRSGTTACRLGVERLQKFQKIFDGPDGEGEGSEFHQARCTSDHDLRAAGFTPAVLNRAGRRCEDPQREAGGSSGRSAA